MQVKLERVENTAHRINTFWFATEKPMDYVAGQFIEMYLPHKNADERGEKHWFTLSSSPTEPLVSITTKKAVGRISTFKQSLFGLGKDSPVIISEPMGDFVLPKDTQIPLVFVAGGIGITPFRSMIKWLIDSEEKRNIVLIYGAKTADELAFLGLFERYGIDQHVILSSNGETSHRSSGPITGQTIQNLSHHKPNQIIYISGPEPFTEKLEKQLLDAGVAKQNLVLDFFPGYKTG